MNFSTRSKLRREERINNNFENILSSLSLEEIITLKLELSTPVVKGKLYGTNIYYSLVAICRDAVVKWALATAPGNKLAADFLGIDYRHLKKLNNTHRYFDYFKEKNEDK